MKVAQYLTWLLMIFISTTTFPLLVSAQCKDHQHSLLLQIKNTLVFNSTQSVRLSQWNQTADCCTWSGIECDADGFVIGLDLSDESISGGMENSTALFSLQYLQRLNLAFNEFNGSQIPSSLGNLTNLTHLNLSYAGFAGQIPVEISSLTRLVVLDLSSDRYIFDPSSFFYMRNFRVKLENPNLKTLVQNFTELRQLYLDGVNISSQGSEWCQALSSSLHKLQILSMSECFLSGPIHQSLAGLYSLLEIYLDGNSLSCPIPGFMANFTNLKILSIRDAGLYGSLPEEMVKMQALETLDLEGNELLNGTLPSSLGNLKNLSVIRLGGCSFTGPIPKSIAKLTKLVSLDLQWNQLEGNLSSVDWKKLENLVFLHLEGNSLIGDIPPSVLTLRNLSELSLYGNRLEGNISSIEWKLFKNLDTLHLSFNSLGGEIPPSLFTLPLLRELDLSYNQFEGQLSEFPNASSSVLIDIDLSGNRLDGSIPMSIFQRLFSLDLSYNKFNGTILLESFGRFENLTFLVLSYNRLTLNASSREILFLPQLDTLGLASCNLGVFPNLQNQTKLSDLDLSNNQISGEIPNWIWNVSGGDLQKLKLNLSHNSLRGLQKPFKFLDVQILDLSYNQLQGNIPLPTNFAVYVDFSGNNFTSTIPVEIGNIISSTEFFSLSNNSLTGEIPNSICNATSVQVLDLSYNKLSGGVPQCLMENTDTLVVLDLKGNNLIGNVSNAFSKDCGLQSLYLNGNRLEGRIPKSLANCKMLEVLDLGNNQIDDRFPCWLKTVSSLRILILRSNKLHGSVDCSNINSTWSDLQIVDLSINNFSGNLPIKSLSTWKTMMVDGDETQSHIEYLPINSMPGLGSYYHDAIKVTSKGLEMELVRILTVFTSIDLSCNRFEGSIPEEIGNFKSLHGLNLSHNALIGVIPSTIGNMKQLESLDLSMNRLSGTVPSQIANLNFLSVLNLSHNHFVGRIPTGTQIQSFLPSSFEGNAELCGPPLNDCVNTTHQHVTGNKVDHENFEFGWQLALFVGIGFGTGFVAVVAPLIFFDKVDLWYDILIHKLLLSRFRK